MKKISGIYRNQTMHWVGDGFPVKNLMSYSRLGQVISPFLLLDYAAPYAFQPTAHKHGVGSHPHRGFETVTIAYQGEVSHQDSYGGGGTIQAGDVQWMTAGSGLVHEEFHSEAFAQQGGNFEMVQLWVNLPAKDKMTRPNYQGITAAQIPVVKLNESGGSLRVIAGDYANQHGPASTFSPVNVWDVQLNAAQVQHFELPNEHNNLLVLLEGELLINAEQAVLDHSVVIFAKDDQSKIQLEAKADARFLILTGEALNEPIEGYGPFVMNTRAEIIQAFEDFNQGKFGQIAMNSTAAAIVH